MISMKKALEHALELNMTLPVCPLTKDNDEKYPQMDLWGCHSIIDTAFTYRTLLIEAACRKQPEGTALEAQRLLSAADPRKYEMRLTASMLRVTELAGILYGLSDSREYQSMKRQLLERPVLKEYHKSLTAVEHMAGLRETEISPGLRSFCSDVLEHPFSMDAYHARRQIPVQEAEKMLPVPDRKHKELCEHYSDPKVLKSALQKEKREPTR